MSNSPINTIIRNSECESSRTINFIGDSILIDKKTLAVFYGVSTKTIESWQNQGMPHFKFSRKMVRYDFKQVGEWLFNVKNLTNYEDISLVVGRLRTVKFRKIDLKALEDLELLGFISISDEQKELLKKHFEYQPLVEPF